MASTKSVRMFVMMVEPTAMPTERCLDKPHLITTGYVNSVWAAYIDATSTPAGRLMPSAHTFTPSPRAKGRANEMRPKESAT